MAPHPQLLLGGASIGMEPNSEFLTPATVSSLLSVLQRHGITRIDTAARYPPPSPGRSESLLGDAKAADKHFVIDTKILFQGATTQGRGDVTPEAARRSVEASFQRLGVDKVATLYIHAPDTETPVAEQVKGLKALYDEGKFERLGISNFSPQQVRDFIAACEENGAEAVTPKVFQGEYNLIARGAEKELLPLLRQHGISFVAFRIVAAGFLGGSFAAGEGREGTRFAADHPLGKAMQQLYGTPKLHQARQTLEESLKPHGIPPFEAGLRWVCYHSALGEADGVILGASKTTQLEANVEAIEKGQLPEDVAEVLSKIWDQVRDD